ncbi:MAG: malto-oligosyltrehalose synthase [Desulfurivibrio sp.]|nr:malto-oligosyltrehalose synthase [Desulfurivibrio sp.]
MKSSVNNSSAFPDQQPTATAPVATYRLQLHPGFGFADAAEVVPYLAELGVSHLYTSPYLQAAAGSSHGYDVVDPSRVNAELGGEEGHRQLRQALRQAELGQVIDLVPNHMAIAGRQNPWWWDVLENGPASLWATYFDVDWESSEDRWPNKVLLPVLGDHYGRVLEAGELQLAWAGNDFTIHYYEHVFPVDPASLAGLLAAAAGTCGSELLGFIADSYAHLPRPTATNRRAVKRRHRDKAVIGQLLNRLCRDHAGSAADQAAGAPAATAPATSTAAKRRPTARAAITAEVERLNNDPDALDALLDNQNYRLAFWRTADRDLGYRRFFDINSLVGLRMENDEVFAATHALPLAWVTEGSVQGLRIDHPDGLRDPTEYFHRLRRHCPRAWIWAEKILESEETLPADWPIDGTTGYDFINLVGGLLLDPAGETELTDFYRQCTGLTDDYPTVIRNCKRQVISDSLGSELNRLTALFVAICERHRRHRDYTRHELHEALRQVAAAFPVYRSYFRPAAINPTTDNRSGGSEPAEPAANAGPKAGVSDNDAASPDASQPDYHYIQQAVATAITDNPELDPELPRFLGSILALEVPGELETELALRFQQFSSPAMAKGVEDTAFYRYHRLLCLNEVGGNPGRFGVSPGEFHQQAARALARYPGSMLAGTTHDTKRGEDCRARLALLSEIPKRWRRQVERWFKRHRRYRRQLPPGGGDGGTAGDSTVAPEANVEYFIYQTLVGAWPLSAERLHRYLEKAMREAKQRTSWTRQDTVYEAAVQDFAQSLLADTQFRTELETFLQPLIPAGRINSLSQTLLRLLYPGVPDIYQGADLWELSLVDPDNRRPVDFQHRRRLLAELPALSAAQIMARMDEGLPKLWLLRQGLQLRRRRPELFGAEGGYRPLSASGQKAQHLVACQRGEAVIGLAPRLVLGLRGAWRDTRLTLPAGYWHNLLTGERFRGGTRRLTRLLGCFPVALLEKE